jgi:dienelactone hydrolase
MMRENIFLKFTLFIALTLMGNMVFAQETIIKLYDGPAPGSEGWTQKETVFEYLSPIWKEKNVALFNVVDPALTVFLPSPGKATGAAMIVCPGGGFSALSWDNEGLNAAKKLAEKGIVAFVLKYRISYSGGTPEEVNLIARTSYGGEKRTTESLELTKKNSEITKSITSSYSAKPGKVDLNSTLARDLGNIQSMAGDDGRRAIEYVRQNAATWNLKPDKIGMIGFSAGGMVVLDVAFNHSEQSKPNTIGVLYGVFGGKGVPADPMPMFLAATQYETLRGAAALYTSWCEARLPAEIHSFTGAHHGFGYRENNDSVNIWIELFCNFLKKTGFIQQDN